jgi:hypothetical protein
MPRLPVSSRRSERDTRGRWEGAAELVLHEGEAHPSPPPPPAWLDRRARRRFRELWQRPESRLWRPAHRGITARLAWLETELEAGRTPSWIFGAITALEDRLCLSPRALRAARVKVLPATENPRENGGGLYAETRRELRRQLAEIEEERG